MIKCMSSKPLHAPTSFLCVQKLTERFRSVIDRDPLDRELIVDLFEESTHRSVSKFSTPTVKLKQTGSLRGERSKFDELDRLQHSSETSLSALNITERRTHNTRTHTLLGIFEFQNFFFVVKFAELSNASFCLQRLKLFSSMVDLSMDAREDDCSAQFFGSANVYWPSIPPCESY